MLGYFFEVLNCQIIYYAKKCKGCKGRLENDYLQ